MRRKGAKQGDPLSSPCALTLLYAEVECFGKRGSGYEVLAAVSVRENLMLMKNPHLSVKFHQDPGFKALYLIFLYLLHSLARAWVRFHKCVCVCV